MIKKYKSGSYKISVTALLMCLMISFSFLTNAKSDINTKNFKLSDSTYLANSLDRAKQVIGYDFKVPDSIPKNYTYAESMSINKIQVGKCYQFILDITFNNQTEGKRLVIKVAKFDQLQWIKNLQFNTEYSDFNYTSKEEPINISGVNGTFLTSTQVPKPGIESLFKKYISKDFIWQDNGIWYRIPCHTYDERDSGSIVYNDISTEELRQVISSMKYTNQVKNQIYESMKSQQCTINDQNDLKQAEEMLGSKPKLLLSLPGGYAPSNSLVQKDEIDEGKSIYSMNTTYKTSPEDMNKTIFLTQYQKGSTYTYDQLIKNGFITSNTGISNPFHKKTIAGTDVFCATDKSDKKKIWTNNTVIYEDLKEVIMCFLWKKNDVCYDLKITNETQENADKIIKAFISD